MDEDLAYFCLPILFTQRLNLFEVGHHILDYLAKDEEYYFPPFPEDTQILMIDQAADGVCVVLISQNYDAILRATNSLCFSYLNKELKLNVKTNGVTLLTQDNEMVTKGRDLSFVLEMSALNRD